MSLAVHAKWLNSNAPFILVDLCTLIAGKAIENMVFSDVNVNKYKILMMKLKIMMIIILYYKFIFVYMYFIV